MDGAIQTSDPIVRSLLDIDFYKLLMQQFIWERYRSERVTWKLGNRTASVKLGHEIDPAELREQLAHVRSLSFTAAEVAQLREQRFYGQAGIFSDAYLEVLRSFQLPEYVLEPKADGQLGLTFEGPWWQTTLWEIYALAIVSEIRSRAIVRRLTPSEAENLYVRAKAKLLAKLEKLRQLPKLNLTDFGTRRRHSFLWQEQCMLAARDILGERFTGTSNVHLALKHGMEAKGTNAHELPMAFAAMARQHRPGDPDALRQSQYDVLRQWQSQYGGNLLVFLPDTFGTTQFLKGAPQWLRDWTGARPDSKNAFEAGEELVEFWRQMGISAKALTRTKLIIFSDALDVTVEGFEPNGTDILDLYRHFDGRVLTAFGWGTNLTNDFAGCHPAGKEVMKPISLVCKVHAVNGQPAVKLSDNFEKAVGPPDEIKLYRRVFGMEGVKNAPVLV